MVWLEIIALNVAVFLLELAGGETVFRLLAFVPANLASAPWTLITSLFVHANPTHLLFNMWALFVFGSVLERVIGAKRFLGIYFLSGIVGNLGFMFFYPSNIAGVGASGAIYGIVGALAVLLPNLLVLVFFIPMPLWMAAVGWAALEFFLSFTPSSIANWVHIVGLFVGIIWGMQLKAKVGSELQYYR